MADSSATIGPGKTYSSIDNWEDNLGGTDGNLTSGTYDGIHTATVYAFDDTAPVSILGWTTDAGGYINLIADSTARHAGVWNGDKYNLLVESATPFMIREDCVRVDGLQIGKSTSSASNQNLIYLDGATSGTSDVRISNCLLKQAGNTSYVEGGIYTNDDDLLLYIWNCIVYGGGAYSGNSNAPIYMAGGTVYIYSTVARSGAYGINAAAGAVVTCKNCYADGGTGTAYVNIDTMVTCASDDNTGTAGLQSILCDTDTFVNVTGGSEDFHLAADGLSPLQGAGTDTSGDAAPLNFTTDIDGNTRALWSIGADDGPSALSLGAHRSTTVAMNW